MNELTQKLHDNYCSIKIVSDKFGCSRNTVIKAIKNKSNSALSIRIREFVDLKTYEKPVRISTRLLKMPCGEVSEFYTRCDQGCHLWYKCPIYTGPPRISGGPVGCKGSSRHNIFQTEQI